MPTPFEISDREFAATQSMLGTFSKNFESAIAAKNRALEYRASVYNNVMENSRDAYKLEVDNYWKAKHNEIELKQQEIYKQRADQDAIDSKARAEDRDTAIRIRRESQLAARAKTKIAYESSNILNQIKLLEKEKENKSKVDGESALAYDSFRGLDSSFDGGTYGEIDGKLEKLKRQYSSLLLRNEELDIVGSVHANGSSASNFKVIQELESIGDDEYDMGYPDENGNIVVPDRSVGSFGQNLPDENGNVSLFPDNTPVKKAIPLPDNGQKEGTVEPFKKPTPNFNSEPIEKDFDRDVIPSLEKSISQFKFTGGSLIEKDPEKIPNVVDNLGRFASLYKDKYGDKDPNMEKFNSVLEKEKSKSLDIVKKSAARSIVTLAASGVDPKEFTSAFNSKALKQASNQYKALGGDDYDVELTVHSIIGKVNQFRTEQEKKENGGLIPGSSEYESELMKRIFPEVVKKQDKPEKPEKVLTPPPTTVEDNRPLQERFKKGRGFDTQEAAEEARRNEVRNQMKLAGIKEDSEHFRRISYLKGEGLDKLLLEAKEKAKPKQSDSIFNTEEIATLDSKNEKEFAKKSFEERFEYAYRIYEKIKKSKDNVIDFSDLALYGEIAPDLVKQDMEEAFQKIRKDRSDIELFNFIQRYKSLAR